jgi:hypothetical protein
LDGAGKEGRRVIAGIVNAGLSVTVRVFDTNDPCGEHACYFRGSITVNEADASGVMAVALGHEYGHSTEKSASDKWGFADNELRAWDQSRKVYDNLKSPFRQQAHSVFDAQIQTLRTSQGRRANRAVLACRAEARANGGSVAACAP